MPKGDGLTMDSAIYQQMRAVIRSPEGRKAALTATDGGHPALGGVDPLLQQKLGSSYNQQSYGPLNAGYEVAAVMRELGYTEAGRGSCPAGCVSRSGQKWKPKG